MDRFIHFLVKYINNDLKDFLKYDYIYLADYQKDNNLIILKSVEVPLPITPRNDIYSISKNNTSSLFDKNITFSLGTTIITNKLAYKNTHTKTLGSALLELPEYLSSFHHIVLSQIVLADEALVDIKIYINESGVIIELIRKNSYSYIGELPAEMINHIAEYLALPDASRFLRTNSRYYQLMNNTFWHEHFIYEFPVLKSPFNSGYLYQELLKNMRIIDKSIKERQKNRKQINQRRQNSRRTVILTPQIKEVSEMNKKMILDEIYNRNDFSTEKLEKFICLIKYLAYEHKTYDLYQLLNSGNQEDLIEKVFQYETADSLGKNIINFVFSDNIEYLPTLLKVPNVHPIDIFLDYLDSDLESHYYDRDNYDSFFNDISLENIVSLLTHPNNKPEDYPKLMEWMYCFRSDIQDYLYNNYWNLLNIQQCMGVFKRLCGTTDPNIKLIVKIGNLDSIKNAYI